jgi:Zn-dependent M28 family amino/carboxypeptidase
MKTLVFIFFFIVFLGGLSIVGWRFTTSLFTENVRENLQLIKKLEQHVYELSHTIGDRSVFKYDALNQAKDYIIEVLTALGYQVDLQPYQVLDKTVYNIVVTKVGSQYPQQQIVVGAHYDTCYNPGADDNASGVAGLLELARLVSDQPLPYTVKFIAFVNEEPPFFQTEKMGSRVYAKRARSRQEDIKAVLVFEMIGFYSDKAFSQRYPPFFGFFYPNKANFIAVIGNLSSRDLVKAVTYCFREHSLFPIASISMFGFFPGVDFSDHWSFWKEGYQALMITDTAFYRSPCYHSQADTYEKLDYQRMAEVVKGFQAVLRSGICK